VHEEYAVQRWPETKRLLGLLVNSSGQAHARNARRLVHATRKEDRRLSAALLAAALAHTPEAAEAINGARDRMGRKPASLARELLRNFPKGRRGKSRRRSGAKKPGETAGTVAVAAATDTELLEDEVLELDGAPELEVVESDADLDEAEDADGAAEPEDDPYADDDDDYDTDDDQDDDFDEDDAGVEELGVDDLDAA